MAVEGFEEGSFLGDGDGGVADEEGAGVSLGGRF